MKDFDYYLKIGEVKKTRINLELAKALLKDMNERIEKIQKLDTKIFAKIIFENAYDSLRDFCDVLLAKEGYKAYSHMASISFLLKKDFDKTTVDELDMLRYKRNSSKYYGESISKEDAEDILDFYKKIKGKIKLLTKEI